MPKLSRVACFEIGVQARLTAMKLSTALNRTERILVLGCFQMEPLARTTPEQEAANLIFALRVLANR